MAVMVTGHRQLVPSGHTGNPWPENLVVKKHHNDLFNVVFDYLKIAFDMGYREFITGMAIGADQLFADAVLALRLAHKSDFGDKIRLIAACPFKGQEVKWPELSRIKYNGIIKCANEVHYVCEPGYAPWKMQKRNEWMVDRAKVVLAIWNGKPGGTTNCVNYAIKKGRYIIRLDPQTFEFEEINR